LLSHAAEWADTFVQMTESEPALLPQKRDGILEAVQRHLVWAAFDDERCVGGLVLWPMTEECARTGVAWYELGTVFVVPDYRVGRLIASGQPMPETPVSFMLYAAVLSANGHRNILSTTTNPVIVKLSCRHGMHQLSFDELPEAARRATCICPEKKTRTSDNRHCALRQNNTCWLLVSDESWLRLGRPEGLGCVCCPYFDPSMLETYPGVLTHVRS
jgi:hypothetical protein